MWEEWGKLALSLELLPQKQKRLNLSLVDFDFIKFKSQFRKTKQGISKILIVVLKELTLKQYKLTHSCLIK